MDIIQSLQNLGLSEKEAQVYFSLLQAKNSSAYLIARKSGLKRPTVYVILEELLKKGLATKIPGKTARFTAIDPEILFSRAKTRLSEAEEDALPQLKALSRKEEYQVKASYFEGTEAIEEMYQKIIKETANEESVGFYGHQEGSSQNIREFWSRLNPQYIKNNIKRRAIIPQHPSVDYYINQKEDKQLEIESLPTETYDSRISLEVYKNFTLIFSPRYLQAMLIDNPDVASVIRQLFEMIWKDIKTKK